MARSAPAPVKLLGWTSLFTDAATEAIYPLLPVFVTRVLGGNAGVARHHRGRGGRDQQRPQARRRPLSDRTGRRKPFVVAGYTIAWLARPLIALAATWQHVFAVRLTDRVGKGLRGAPRDAMLGALAPPGQRGRVFGFHRAMDHSRRGRRPARGGRVSVVLPRAVPHAVRARRSFPGALAVAMLLFVPEVRAAPATCRPDEHAGETAAPARTRPLPPRRSSASSSSSPSSRSATRPTRSCCCGSPTPGLPTVYLPLAWAALHVVKAGLSTLGGALSDRFGREPPDHRRLARLCGRLCRIRGQRDARAAAGLVPRLRRLFRAGRGQREGAGRRPDAGRRCRAPRSAGTTPCSGFGALAASLLFGALWDGVRAAPPRF